MQTKKLLRKILDELSASKEELRRLKRQINEMNDTVEQYFTASAISPDDESVDLETLDEYVKPVDAPFEEPLPSPYDTLPSDVEPADPEVHG